MNASDGNLRVAQAPRRGEKNEQDKWDVASLCNNCSLKKVTLESTQVFMMKRSKVV